MQLLLDVKKHLVSLVFVAKNRCRKIIRQQELLPESSFCIIFASLSFGVKMRGLDAIEPKFSTTYNKSIKTAHNAISTVVCCIVKVEI